MLIKDLHNFNLPEAEGKVLEYWKKNKIFERSLRLADERGLNADQDGKRRGLARKNKKNFVFFEGPPTANGRPGIHHVLARAFKDVILRYKTMRGYYVPRRAGWDTHGLPVEIQVEKELGLKSKKDIEKYGIAEFNKKCRESVWKFKDEWERLTERMGYWLDLKNPYITYEKNYIETLWWIIAQFWKRQLLYKGHRVAPWCPRCGTALSSHEMAQGYKEVVDNSVFVKFKVRFPANRKAQIGKGKNTYILSWTTTPWTLPGNVALAVGGKINYVFVEIGDEVLVVAKERMKEVGAEGKIIKEVKGKDLVGLEYEPLFDITRTDADYTRKYADKIYKVYGADFVTTTEGTGVVHTAVMYGEDDYQLGTKLGLPKFHTVDEQGKFTKDVKGFAGLFVKSKETEKKIFEYLNKNGNLLKTEKYEHEYPHCWRCATPLLYYARESWFVAMSKLKKKLVANNDKINWTPEHIKNGRFGEWLKDVKDWNFSRERYWGTPLPIWECKKCGKTEVVESLEDLDGKVGGARNEYVLMRHGEAETNVFRIWDSGEGKYHLTDKGKKQVEKTAEVLKKERIDLVFSSDVLRAKETASIVAKVLGKKTVFDKRLREMQVAEFSGKSADKYFKMFAMYVDMFDKKPEGGESLVDLRKRVWDFAWEIERKYKGKKILIVTHDYPNWMLAQAMSGWTREEATVEMKKRRDQFLDKGSFEKTDFRSVPRDETGEVDLHRPYVDEVKLKCKKCEGEMRRVKELCDVWFDSGSMPWASRTDADFNTDGRGKIPRKSASSQHKSAFMYPADYIAEAVDQTRGWFYTLLAVATALGLESPYKNVICLGHINDKNGIKMSKSKGNVVDPWQMAEKYGMDVVRWYMYSATPPGEPKNFDEIELAKTYRKFHLILWNSLMFYRTYADKKLDVRRKKLDENKKTSHIPHPTSNVLDQWILARLSETSGEVEKSMDEYKVREAVLEIERLVDDLSRWYIRRSRRRLQKAEDKKDYEACSRTLRYVLVEILKMTAPFNPFFAEILWNVLGEKDSVHLEEWPEVSNKGQATRDKLVKEMEEVRRLAAVGLAKRAEAGVKVRQPLATLRVAGNRKSLHPRPILLQRKIANNKELLEILKEEVNVKNVVFDKKLNPPAGGEVELDLNITPELKEEGIAREFTRAAQELRQKAGLMPKDAIIVMLELPEGLSGIIQRSEKFLKKEVGAKEIKYQRLEKFGAEVETKIGEEKVWMGIRKI